MVDYVNALTIISIIYYLTLNESCNSMRKSKAIIHKPLIYSIICKYFSNVL
jgi:hypothetical protein